MPFSGYAGVACPDFCLPVARIKPGMQDGLSATDLKTVSWVFGGAETKDTSLGSSVRGMQPVEALELLC